MIQKLHIDQVDHSIDNEIFINKINEIIDVVNGSEFDPLTDFKLDKDLELPENSRFKIDSRVGKTSLPFNPNLELLFVDERLPKEIYNIIVAYYIGKYNITTDENVEPKLTFCDVIDTDENILFIYSHKVSLSLINKIQSEVTKMRNEHFDLGADTLTVDRKYYKNIQIFKHK